MELINGNSNQIDKTRESIKKLIEDYKIELETLSRMINVDYNWLKDYMDGKRNLNEFYANAMDSIKNNRELVWNPKCPEPSSLSNKIYILSEGIRSINEDDRVKGIIDGLIIDFGIRSDTLAIYAGIGLEDVQNFMKDTNSITYENKYKLAVASLLLHFLVNGKKSVLG
ncbi:HTH domain-containing protein [Clostridium beijerinckii]|uniref:HTH domain-containing protein n=1 Tax=Clostridium beijerinckii TaxID=1520 RepID=UPI00232B74A0|nr:HTH domain-containing protein [Clostridium beijerinckii]